MEFVIGTLILIFGFLVGIVIGIFVGIERMRKAVESCSVGHLRIDHSEPDEPTRMFVELKGVTPDMIAQHKFATFEVINESYISQN